MSNVVTIGIPVYKRFEYLPNVLRIVAAQDYPYIELLVSDNGMNGSAVPEIVSKHYPKPYTFRQNPSTVNISTHFNQLINSASGEYVVVLADDDEISPNYVSELILLLQKHPEASVALAAQENIDGAGKVLKRSKDTVPEKMSGRDFIRTTWGTHEYGFQSLCTFLAKKDRVLACGGFADLWQGTSDEDLLVIKLCVDNFVVFSNRCAFRKRIDESTLGYSISTRDLARGIREFLSCLDSDPQLLEYTAQHPSEWAELKRCVFNSSWKSYYFRWANMYRKRMSPLQWAVAGFALPPGYYTKVVSKLTRASLATMIMGPIRRFFPQAYDTYRVVKAHFRRAI
jgi:glycosyltransferase involved in cell wall biosynthesis